MTTPDLETLLTDHHRLGADDLGELLTAALADRLRGADPAERARALEALPRAGLPTGDLVRLCAHARGDFDDDARRRCAEALAALPGCPAARLALQADLLRDSADPRTRGAIRGLLLAGARKFAGSSRVGYADHLRRARRLLRRRRAGLASLHLGIALEQRPLAARTWAKLAFCHALRRREEPAQRCLREAVGLGEGDAAVHHLCGHALRRLGRIAEAERAFTRAADLAPGDWRARYQLGKLCLAADRPLDAVAHLTGALKQHPDDARLLLQRGLAHRRSRNLEAAIADLEAAQDARPESLRIGRHLEEARRRRDAVADGPAGGGPREDDDEIPIERPQLGFDDVIGLEGAKKAIRNLLVLPVNHPEWTTRYGLPRSGGILLWGPPGVGKTMLAQAAASAVGGVLIRVRLSDLLSKFVGETEKAITRVFAVARQHRPCILFFDELEALGAARSESMHRWEYGHLAAFLAEMSALLEDHDAQVAVIGCTNVPWTLDKALVREGRLGRHIHVSAPDAGERARLFERHLRAPCREIDFAELGRLAANCSGAQIRAFCHEAAIRACEAAVASSEEVPVQMPVLREVIAAAHPDLRRWQEEARKARWFVDGTPETPIAGFAA